MSKNIFQTIFLTVKKYIKYFFNFLTFFPHTNSEKRGEKDKRTENPISTTAPHLWMRLVSGSISFFPRRGSRGVRAPNCHTKQTHPFSPRPNWAPSHPCVRCGSHTHQFDDLDEHPVVGGGGHELEEQRGKGQVVLGVPPGQLADDVHGGRVHTCRVPRKREAEQTKAGV